MRLGYAKQFKACEVYLEIIAFYYFSDTGLGKNLSFSSQTQLEICPQIHKPSFTNSYSEVGGSR